MQTILIVEDNEHQRYLYRRELQEYGYEVLEAESGDDALDIVDTVRLDLVVLDISMPGMDGIETLGRMLAKNRGLPVILHTAYSNYRDNFMSWSADRYVVKSSDLTDLKKAIDELLTRSAPKPIAETTKPPSEHSAEGYGPQADEINV